MYVVLFVKYFIIELKYVYNEQIYCFYFLYVYVMLCI